MPTPKQSEALRRIAAEARRDPKGTGAFSLLLLQDARVAKPLFADGLLESLERRCDCCGHVALMGRVTATGWAVISAL